MKLYYAPGACSLATRIWFHEAGISADYERVDLATKITETGQDFTAINPKGSVPVLVLDDGAILTENVAILDWLAGREQVDDDKAPLGRTRLIEMLSYLSSELHVAFKPFWHGAIADPAAAEEEVAKRLALLGSRALDPYLFGSSFTVADAYLFVMLRWTARFHIHLSPSLLAYFEQVAARPAVQEALAEEERAKTSPSRSGNPATRLETTA